VRVSGPHGCERSVPFGSVPAEALMQITSVRWRADVALLAVQLVA